MDHPTDGYDPYLYQITHRGNPGDASFYIAACREQSDILELGCGSGRLLMALVEAGHHPQGVDLHPGMLAQLKETYPASPGLEAKLTLHQQDIRSLDLAQQFDRILLPYNLLFCLLTREDIVACLRAVAAHLKPNGACIFDVYQADDDVLETYLPHQEPARIDLGLGPGIDDGDEEYEEDEWDMYAILEEGGKQIQIAETRLWEPKSKRLDASYRYRFFDPALQQLTSEVTYTIPQIYLHADEIRSLFDEAGMMWTQVYGDFRGSRLTEESEHLIAWAKKIP